MAKFFTPTKLSENIRQTPEGYLLCLDVPIARTGWQQYGPNETPLEVGEDGFVWILREVDEVFKPQTIASFNAKSITIKHPNDWVAPDNWQELTRGIAQNIRRGEEKDEDGEEMLLADLLITDEMTIGLVKQGLREVSCGYDAEYEETGKGEGRQYNIVGNHIALVEAGRAGPTYAIKDHKGEIEMNEKLKKLLEQIKTLGKTVDEAVKLEDAKDKAKKAKTGDEDKEKEDKEKKASDADSYDELMKAVKDLSEKVDALGGSKDDAEEKEDDKESEDDSEKKDDDKEDKSKDDGEKEASIEERVKALEAAVAKVLEKLDAGSEDEDSEKKDDDMSGSEDEESEESDKEKKTGDAALAEILAPGVKAGKKEDLKVKALKAAYATEEGKEVINSLTGGKAPTFDSKENVTVLFNAAASLLKEKRGNGLEGTKKATVKDSDKDTGPMTAEKLNEINRAHYAQK